eukprot:TRINITY_DN1797_c0_g1_i1.p1 TRINITY_DN1797_c0_g1~~TRINITY_DN1797_c0_g1_i1.p1  ORF type:complete len:148 (-),score=24.72 TRINITY_DN1797_c0_g1_i1:36-479(-)
MFRNQLTIVRRIPNVRSFATDSTADRVINEATKAATRMGDATNQWVDKAIAEGKVTQKKMKTFPFIVGVITAGLGAMMVQRSYTNRSPPPVDIRKYEGTANVVPGVDIFNMKYTGTIYKSPHRRETEAKEAELRRQSKLANDQNNQQ